MKTILVAGVCVLLSGCVTTPVMIPDIVVPVVTDRSSVNSIALEKLVIQAQGQSGVIGMGILCIPHGRLVAAGSSNSNWQAMEIIQSQFDAIGYPVTTSSTDLFATIRNDEARLRLAGRVTNVQNNVCYPMAGFGNLSTGSADAIITVEWQVYDNISKHITLKLNTTGVGNVKQADDPLIAADTQAVRMAVRKFIASSEFQDIAHAVAPIQLSKH